MGESIFEGTITKWLKKTGDKVQRDEPLFEISTDKVDAEIPSPNAGVAEAAFAGALGVELGGTVHYYERVEDRPRLGAGPRPETGDIDRAIELTSHVELALVALLGAWGVSGRR